MEETLNLILMQVKDINKKVTAYDQKFAGIDEKFAEVNEKFEKVYTVMNEKFAETDEKFEKVYAVMNEKFAETDEKFEKVYAVMNEKFEKLTQDISQEIKEFVNVIENREFKIKRTLNNHYNENIKNYKLHGIRLSKLEIYQQKIKYAVAQLNQEIIT